MQATGEMSKLYMQIRNNLTSILGSGAFVAFAVLGIVLYVPGPKKLIWQHYPEIP